MLNAKQDVKGLAEMRGLCFSDIWNCDAVLSRFGLGSGLSARGNPILPQAGHNVFTNMPRLPLYLRPYSAINFTQRHRGDVCGP